MNERTNKWKVPSAQTKQLISVSLCNRKSRGRSKSLCYTLFPLHLKIRTKHPHSNLFRALTFLRYHKIKNSTHEMKNDTKSFTLFFHTVTQNYSLLKIINIKHIVVLSGQLFFFLLIFFKTHFGFLVCQIIKYLSSQRWIIFVWTVSGHVEAEACFFALYMIWMVM